MTGEFMMNQRNVLQGGAMAVATGHSEIISWGIQRHMRDAMHMRHATTHQRGRVAEATSAQPPGAAPG